MCNYAGEYDLGEDTNPNMFATCSNCSSQTKAEFDWTFPVPAGQVNEEEWTIQDAIDHLQFRTHLIKLRRKVKPNLLQCGECLAFGSFDGTAYALIKKCRHADWVEFHADDVQQNGDPVVIGCLKCPLGAVLH